MVEAKNIKVILITLMVGILIPLFSAFAAEPTNPGTSGSSCSKKCSDSKCHMAMNGSFFKTLAEKNNMNSKCLAEQSKNSCINTVPVSCGGSYNGLGYRPKGAGGNEKPRNHLGSDIGSHGCNPKNKILVYAAATGVVRYKSTAGCGGRTVLIEHDKACEGGGKYKTVYRHLLNYNVQIGQTVEKDKPIGVMGGSNAATAGSSPCDNPAQKGMPGYSRPPQACNDAASKCGGAPNYSIHLHIEFVDGAFSASDNSVSAARNVLSPNCDTLPILCGGCPTNASSCGGSGIFTDGNTYDGSSDFNDVNEAESETDSCVYDDTIEADSCVFCGMFKTVFNTASTLAKTANDNLAGPSATLVGIGFLIWLAIYILKQLSNFGGTSSGEMLKGIIYQGFRVAAVILILNGFIYAVMDITLNPVMQTGLDFVQDINGAQACDKNAEYMKDIKGYDKTYQGSDVSGGLPKQMGESIMCSIKHLENATGTLMRLGKYSICISFGRYALMNIIPHLFYLSTGIFLWICGLAVLLMFPFCLVDCIIQLCVAAAMLPCGIAAFAFKITSKYLKIIWGFFMNAMFNFVFMAIVVYIINKYMLEWLGIGAVSPNTPEFDKMFIKAIGGTPDQPALAWYGPAGLKALGIIFICFCFMDEAKSMANKFASGAGVGGRKGLAPMAAGTIGTAAQSIGGAGLKLTGKGLAAGGSFIANRTNAAIGNKFRSGVNHLKGRILSRLPGGYKSTDANGNAVYGTRFHMFGVNYSRTVTKGENGVWTQMKEMQQRSGVDKAFDKVYDKNGNALKQQLFDANGNAVKDADGNNVMVDAYKARHRIFGIKTGNEDMTARLIDGKVVYETATGSSKLITSMDGQAEKYQTIFTGSIKDPFKNSAKNAFVAQTVRTTSDTVSRTRETVERDGTIVASQSQYLDAAYSRLVRKDGTIRNNEFEHIINMSDDKAKAMASIVEVVAAKRGIQLSNTFQKRDINLDAEGNMILNQVNSDNSVTQVIASLSDNQMLLNVQKTDINGNMSINRSNGIMSKTETYNKQKDGTYNHDIRFSFSDYIYSHNAHMSPLDHNGKWGNMIDRDQAMKGFTQQDYDKHIAQLKLNSLSKTMRSDDYRNSAEVQKFYSMLHQKGLKLENIKKERKK